MIYKIPLVKGLSSGLFRILNNYQLLTRCAEPFLPGRKNTFRGSQLCHYIAWLVITEESKGPKTRDSEEAALNYGEQRGSKNEDVGH